ncbi:MAG: hypothetical protein GKR93_12110 [Gammaproteobacteria bacterium]|nr:hypothetical protein [Gammaproteobacteria bacterium]
MSKEIIRHIQATILHKNTVSLHVQVKNKTGFLRVAAIELLQDFNSISTGDIVPIRVPLWHLELMKLA